MYCDVTVTSVSIFLAVVLDLETKRTVVVEPAVEIGSGKDGCDSFELGEGAHDENCGVG